MSWDEFVGIAKFLGFMFLVAFAVAGGQ